MRLLKERNKWIENIYTVRYYSSLPLTPYIRYSWYLFLGNSEFFFIVGIHWGLCRG